MGSMKKIAAFLSMLPLAMGTEEAMQKALNAWQREVAAYEAAVKEAPSDDARASITRPDENAAARRLWHAVSGRTGSRKLEKGKGSIPVFEFEKSWAFPGIVWILNHQQAFASVFSEDELNQLNFFSQALIDSLHRVHFSNPAAGDVAPSISASSNVRDYELLHKIYMRNQNKQARAAAALGMSLMLNDPMISSVEGSEAMARAKRLYYLKQSILLGGSDGKFGNQPITTVAMDQAYFLRHLAVGAVAQRIKVKDMQEQQVELPSPGKPHLLLFWSPESPIAVSMMQSLGKLKKQYPALEICPIMPHYSGEEGQSMLQNLGIAESYMDDADGSAGRAYRIGMCPTTVLIDKQCRILYGGTPDMKLQAALEAAMAPPPEIKSKPGKQPRVRVVNPAAPSAPAIQPGGAPAGDEVPGLREMPKF